MSTPLSNNPFAKPTEKVSFFKKYFGWISDKHRLVIINDGTFQEEQSIKLTVRNVAIFAAIAITVFTLFIVIVARLFSSPRLPAITDTDDVRTQLGIIYTQLDSLEQEIVARDMYIEKIQALLNSNFEYEKDVEDKRKLANTSSAPVTLNGDSIPEKLEATAKLMETSEHESELTNLVSTSFLEDTPVDNLGFVTPVKGIVSDTFAPIRKHYGTDIVAPKGSVIKATQNGTVIVATWAADTGHMIGIQHANNVISFYKHNSALLKRMGDQVNAGEAIAIIGNSGEQTDGPHLHFELWYHGLPVNAQKYINF